MSCLKRLLQRIARGSARGSGTTRLGKPKEIELVAIVNGTSMYVGLDDQGTLKLSKSSESELNMLQYETEEPQVVEFSNLRRDFFLIGQLEGSNVVRGEYIKEQNDAFNGREQWHIRRDSNGVLLQYYERSYQNKDWKKFGWFFIINVDESGSPTFELGDYDTAKKKGIFRIDL